jgi:glycine cleavage system transcriptional repressor
MLRRPVQRSFAVAVMGRDRPGIVAAVSGRLLELGCNVEDVITSVLSGHFALMLVCSGPADLTAEAMRAGLDGLPADVHLAVWPADERPERPRASHVLTVYGPDRPGIVHRVASALAGLGVNISDMTCRLGRDGASLYALTVEVELPAGLAPERLDAAVRDAVRPLGLELSLAAIEAEEL